MVSRLTPLEIAIGFEDRTYQLGESIRIDVELTPRMDVTVREARVELVCLASFTEVGSSQQYFGIVRGDTGVPMSEPFGSDLTAGSRESEHTETYRGPTFLHGQRLREGTPIRERVRFSIPAELPENVSGYGPRARANMDWSIQVTVDVAGARDMSEPVPVHVSQFAQDDSLTPEQQRDRAREAAQERWDNARRGKPTDD